MCPSSHRCFEAPRPRRNRVHWTKFFLAKIALGKLRSNKNVDEDSLLAIDSVNRKLDMLTGEMNGMTREKQHLAVAETIICKTKWLYSTGRNHNPGLDAQNIFYSAIVISDLPLIRTLLEEQQLSSSPVNLNGITPYFSRPLVIAAA